MFTHITPPTSTSPIVPYLLGAALFVGLSLQALSLIMINKGDNDEAFKPVAQTTKKPDSNQESVKVVPQDDITTLTVDFSEPVPTPEFAVPSMKLVSGQSLEQDLGKKLSDQRQQQQSETEATGWLESVPEHHHTLQLVMAKNQDSTRKFFDRVSSSKPTAFVEMKIRGQHWFAVVEGDYSSAASARNAAEAYFEKTGKQAWARPVSRIRKSTVNYIASAHP